MAGQSQYNYAGYPPANTAENTRPPFANTGNTPGSSAGFGAPNPQIGAAQYNYGAAGYTQPGNVGGMMQGQAAMTGTFRGGAAPGGSNWGGGGSYDSDVERDAGTGGGADGMTESFSDKVVRRGFIRKVYGILSIQLIITGTLISCFMFIDSLKRFAVENQYLYWIATIILFVCMFAMACFESARRKSPNNYIFLGIFTICEGFMLATVAVQFEADAVLMAVGICAAITIALTLFAFQTKYDFTTCGGMLCGMMMVLFMAGLLMIFLPYNKWAMIGYGSAGALIFSMYIVFDTQLMMGGSHKYALDPEEYVFAALNLYLDIINLFLYILIIIKAARGD